MTSTEPGNSGSAFGQYEIIDQVGHGGMATVYRGYHPRLDREVAIKVMHQTFLQDPNFLARFEREARIVARLEHPNVVPVYDYAEFNGQPYLVMKYVDGDTLKDRLRAGTLSSAEALNVITVVADALTYAHEEGVLHRDVKPSNILIDSRGMPYLTDFGLARLAQMGESTMSADMMLGTPQYISPEQARGEKDLTPATDIYSLGIVLYEMVVGRVPYAGDTTYAIVHNHIYGELPMPAELNPDVPPAVERVLLKALSKEPKDRYPTANAMIADYRRALEGRDVEAPAPRLYDPTPGSSSRVSRGGIPAPPVPEPPSGIRKPLVPPARDSSAPRLPAVPAPFGEFGRKFEEIGRKVEEAIREGSKNFPVDVNRLQWKPGAKWANVGGRQGFYLPEEIKATEEASLPEDEIIRRRVEKKLKDRGEMFMIMSIFAFSAVFLWIIWALTDFGGFPWPIFPTLGLFIPSFVIIYSYYQKHGGGRERREDLVRREIERERERLGLSSVKRKHDDDYDDDRHVRLTGDGEFTDSFVRDVDTESRRGRSRGRDRSSRRRR